MVAPPDNELLKRAANVFREFGVTDGVFVFEPTGSDELGFAVTPGIAAKLPEARIVDALSVVLNRKVFLSTAWNTWPELVRPLRFEEVS